jgi:hypothetical protein
MLTTDKHSSLLSLGISEEEEKRVILSTIAGWCHDTQLNDNQKNDTRNNKIKHSIYAIQSGPLYTVIPSVVTL